ncbi:MAG: DUF4922 domain-containing protein [Tannerellaceae bacterium]|nr:DUF4922 domain-containing protein [Tannerellaceae bacterium]
MDKQLSSAGLLALFNEQLAAWDMARENYKKLADVKEKQFRVGGLDWRVQFNPARARSSAAKVDKASIERRPCFLCPANRPPQQRGLRWNGYEILVNPFPILPQHFTIPVSQHVPQQIAGRFGDLLQLAKQFAAFTWLYNGPHAGASAPDHMHFQAGTKGFLPIEKGWKALPAEPVYADPSVTVSFAGYMFVIETGRAEVAAHCFQLLYDALPVPEEEVEPLMNIVVSYADDKYTCFIFPREKHRPARYYKEGEEQMLVSPGVVDVAGVMILVVEKDFDLFRASDIREVMEEVILNRQQLNAVIDNLKEKYKDEKY